MPESMHGRTEKSLNAMTYRIITSTPAPPLSGWTIYLFAGTQLKHLPPEREN
ncbi:MAG: hypothetical protein ACLFUF_04675 [Opitutales bacterium]